MVPSGFAIAHARKPALTRAGSVHCYGAFRRAAASRRRV